MSRHLPPLRALQAFEAVARTRSVTAAAGELSITPSAVSHRLRNLEAHLGISLFHRAQRRMTLSDAGRDYLQSIESAFDRIERASQRLAGGMASDVLTVHCPPSFAPAWLVPRIGRFLAPHPEIDLRIHASPTPVDFFRTDTDVEIRSGNSDWAGLVVTPLMADTLTPLCPPALRDALGPDLRPEDLLRAPLIFSERAPLEWEQWFRARGVRSQPQRGLRFDRGYLALQAAASGLGIALESLVFAGQYLESGALVRLFPRETGDTIAGAHTLVYPPVYGEIQKVRLFRDWILRECAEGEEPAPRR
ncbi:LysR family transcriptional regulator [Arsenicitalea aurantiaca]|uniref:LysR family transcriptional regulator n=1 Tax=Arsenicitalea aurantiaca TaxID=1783274 RepID=A0A433XEW4_9HYPH|nr:LysR substrate-binding domain-containing protein [Arsenicitalea aurantiaca]RUT32488.1 LysR family transcriptional regulator [Arsenicitalea aurantiaca]